MPDLEKFIPKIPAFAFQYWDGFLGICFVLAALVLGAIPGNSGLLLSGFGLLTLSMARRNWHYIGGIRTTQYSAQYKRTLIYPKLVASVVWVGLSWVCFRYAALNFQLTLQWARWIFHY